MSDRADRILCDVCVMLEEWLPLPDDNIPFDWHHHAHHIHLHSGFVRHLPEVDLVHVDLNRAWQHVQRPHSATA